MDKNWTKFKQLVDDGHVEISLYLIFYIIISQVIISKIHMQKNVRFIYFCWEMCR